MNNGWSKLAIEKKSNNKHSFSSTSNCEQFGIVIMNDTPSDSAPLFKMLKTLGNKTSTSMLHRVTQNFLSCWEAHKHCHKQQLETRKFIINVHFTHPHGNYNQCVSDFETNAPNKKYWEVCRANWSSLTFKRQRPIQGKVDLSLGFDNRRGHSLHFIH